MYKKVKKGKVVKSLLDEFGIKEYKYILIGKKAVPCKSVLKWGRELEKDRILAKEKVGYKEVSTVFLGINHNLFGKKPLLFETMVFSTRPRKTRFGLTPRSYDDYTRRYSTWTQAMKGHKEVVGQVRLDNLK